MKLPIIIPSIVLGLSSQTALCQTIFADDFDSGYQQWSSSGNVSVDTSVIRSGQSLYLKETGQVSAAIDVSSSTNLNVSFYLASKLLESSDYCYGEYSVDGGNSFTTMASMGNGQDDRVFRLTNYPIADPSSGEVILRFRAATGGADHCYVEDVVMTADVDSTPSEPTIDFPTQSNLGNVVIGNSVTKMLQLSNSGASNLSISSVSSLSGDLSVSSDNCTGASLAAAQSCQINVDFTPSSTGSVNQQLTISSNDANTPIATISITATGEEESSGGYIENYQPLNGSGNVTRSQLTYDQLNGSGNITSLVSIDAFAVPSEAAQPDHQFSGGINLISPENAGTGQFTEHRDTFRYTSNGDDPRKHIPDFDYQFVQSGTHLIPESRGILMNTHEYWEYILEPGRVWKENSDNGDSRAAIPFTLIQKNSNCTHNGIMSFTFDDTSMSKVAYQISSETCLYYQFDMWGSVAADYTPAVVADSLTIKQDHQSYEAKKVPTRALSELANDYPAANIDVANFGHSSEVSPDYMSMYGVYVDGIHYTAGCETRTGTYPYCDRLRVPSYSTAKTAMAGTASMRLEQLYPGYMNQDLTNIIPEAAADEDGDWLDVTPNNAIDMATGNYRLSSGYLSDEHSSANDTGFFLVLDHQGKLDYSLSRYPRKATPGTVFNYHTTDTYIATVAAQNFIKSQRGASADIFRDIIVNDIWSPLNVDKGTQDTRRTYDSVGMPFGGYGLTYLRDDIIKIARFTGIDDGQINGQQILDPAELSIAMFEDPNTPPLDVGFDDKSYSNSVWAKTKSTSAECVIYAPYMSGYGGIQFVMLPNDVIYYYVSDNDEFVWEKAFQEAGKIAPYCP